MTAIRFSSSDYAERERKAALEEQHAIIMGMDIQGVGPEPMADMRGRMLPGAGLIAVNCTPHIARRTSAHVADGNDDWGLLLPIAGRSAITHKGRRQEIIAPGEIYLSPGDIPFDLVVEKSLCVLAISIPRQELESKLVNPDAILMKKSRPTRLEELRLLTNFAQLAIRDGDDLLPAAFNLTSTYIRDLAALILEADSDNTEQARSRGLRAVRLQALKQFIKSNCQIGDLSLETVAARHNISPHYVRKLFYDAGTSFSDYLLEVRLAAVYQQLRDPLHSHKTVAELAFDAGFNNLSWFNRAFRRRYDMTPSDARALLVPADGICSGKLKPL